MTIQPIPEAYTVPCEHAGTLETLAIPNFSPATVYLPYGYDQAEQRCSVFYLLHGGGGDSSARALNALGRNDIIGTGRINLG